MPLIKGTSDKSFSKNVSTEMNAGKPQKQSLAIAYSMKKKAEKEKMAMGGMMEGEYDPTESPMPKHNSAAMMEDDRDLNQHGEDETGPMSVYCADGGEVEDPHPTSTATIDPDKAAAMQAAMRKSFAEGGDVHEMDMIDRIMKQRNSSDANCYSEGGEVANETSQESASMEPHEYDVLVKDDDLEGHYSGSEEIGDAREDEDRRDIVARIMRQRKSGRGMPNPA